MSNKCKECGSILMPVESGFVCPNGHGKLILRSHFLNQDDLDDDDWDDLGDDEDWDDEDDDDWDDDDWDDDDEDFEECGQLPRHLGGGCTLAGTEHCDFDCPFRDVDLAGMSGGDEEED